jgi:hypothetical protein
MHRSKAFIALTVGLFAATAALAAPAGAPAGSTGVCKDGSYYSGAVKKGACRGHQGVKDWWGGDAAAPATSAAPAVAAAPAPAVVAPVAKPTSPAAKFTPPAVAAAGGGAGMVWANASSKVYHCPSDKWYGKTKQGEYLSEADAKAKGYHADHGKACQ